MKKILLLTLFLSSLQGQSQTINDSSINSRFNRIDKLLGVLHEFRIVTYIQTEWQRADTAGAASFAGGNFPAAANNRFLLRRGRFKLSYEHSTAKEIKVIEFAFQFDATERGFLIKDFYGRINDPWTGWFGIQGGIFRQQFGYETYNQPSTCESPELARMNQTILPNEQELGENLIIESPKTFKPLYLRIDAGIVNGTGIGVGSETGTYQSRKNFLGRLWVGKNFYLKKDVSLNLTASGSYYNGSVLQTTRNVFAVETNTRNELMYTNIADSSQINKQYYKRTYAGAHLQLDVNYALGSTLLRGEFIAGQQPGTASSSSVPTGVGNAPPGADLYLRNFNGAIFYFSQTFKHKISGHPVSHDITFKFDWYNPNTRFSQKDLSTAADPKVSGADIEYRTYGVGYVFHPAEWLKFMVWYDIVQNSGTHIKGYTTDLKDNVLTIRTQFYFDTWWFNGKK